jgi:hypothetical protein
MFNEKSRLVGVTVAEMIMRCTVATADLNSVGQLLKHDDRCNSRYNSLDCLVFFARNEGRSINRLA